MMAADLHAAMLYAGGYVHVNGKITSKPGAIFEGDVIQTADAPASITANGSTIMLPANSTLTYGKESVQLGCGTAGVRTSQGLKAQAGEVTIAPAQNEAQFGVVQMADRIEIASLSGAVNVHHQGRTQALASGASITLPVGCSMMPAAAAAAAAAAPPQGQAGAGAGFAGGALAPAIAVVATVAVAVIATVMVTEREVPNPVSPVQP